MFKKENIVTTIVGFIVLLIIGLGIYGSINKKSTETENEATVFKTTTEKGFLMEEQPLIGKEGAKAELQLYFDYMCSHCANWESTVLDEVQELIEENEEVALRFINYQFLTMNSVYAGMGGEMVYEYAPENFVTYSKSIFEKQINMNKEKIVKEIAKNIPTLTEEEIEKKIDAQEYMDHILSDKEYGSLMGVQSTPTVMLNGEIIQGANEFKVIKTAVEKELKKKEENVKENETKEEVKEEEKKEEKGE